MGARLHYIHDPLCGWCYAAQPLIHAVRQKHDPRLSLVLHGGGLFDAPRAVDPAMAAHLIQSDERIAQYSGQLFGDAYRQGLLADQPTVLDSLPPIAALLAAESLDAARSYSLLVAIQNAHYQQGLRVVEADVLAELAGSVGLDEAAFADALAAVDPTDIQAHLRSARALLARVGGQGFPTVVLEQHGETKRLDHERFYGQPEVFARFVADQLATDH